jgi:hypothetical protein
MRLARLAEQPWGRFRGHCSVYPTVHILSSDYHKHAATVLLISTGPSRAVSIISPSAFVKSRADMVFMLASGVEIPDY